MVQRGDAKGHRKANLKALTEDLLSHFSALEEDHAASKTSRKGADVSVATIIYGSEEEQGMGQAERDGGSVGRMMGRKPLV